MQYSFLGFSVPKMMELELDMKDMAILRYFIDFRDTNKMKAEVIDGKPYYWVNYSYMAEEMPFLKLSKQTVMRKMLKLRDLGILDHHTMKDGGTFSYFALGSNYMELISSAKNSIKSNGIEDENDIIDPMSKKAEGVLKNNEGMLKKVDPCVKKSTPLCQKRLNKDSSTIDSSIIDINNKNIKKEIDEVVSYLNSKVGARYKSNSKDTIRLITARLNEGYSLDDFKVVIDKKTKEWVSTQFEQYLTPKTLFGTKFETYLNQKINKSFKDSSKLRFDNFTGRDQSPEDMDSLEKKLLGW